MKKEFFVERQGQRFVLYAGLLDEAHEQGLKSITTTLLQIPSEENRQVAICQAVVETSKGTFTGIGDAAPNNVARPMLNCLIRMSETRAKARALRDAVNIGAAALEELDGGDNQENNFDHRPNYAAASQPQRARIVSNNGNANTTSNLAAVPTNQPAVQDNNLATDRQLQAIYNIAYKRLFMSEDELQSRIQKSFGTTADKLTRNDASQLIKSLNENVA